MMFSRSLKLWFRRSLLLATVAAGVATSLFARAEDVPLGRNPILPGFNPDPSICRVGDDYYIANSSFEYFPGVPIYHSRDLVNWQRIGYALSTKEQLDLTGVAPSAGIYAPTLRFHNGVFYMITAMIGSPVRKGLFFVTATNPAGPWSPPRWITGARGIDPSLFFDDNGAVYICANTRTAQPVNEKQRDIWIRQLNLETFETEGPEGILSSAEYFATGKIGSAKNFESPHLYKKNGTYYLLIAHGGTGKNHAVSIWRSQHPLGPWEANPANPILTHRDDAHDGITCTGHADLVQAQNGNWWMVLLGVRGTSGKSPMERETFLTPVEWSGAWPVVNPGPHQGKVDLLFTPPGLARGKASPAGFLADFAEATLAHDWNCIRTPMSQWWDLLGKPGWLTLLLRPEQLTENGQPSFLGIRVTQPACRAETRVDFQPADAHGCAGLAILRAATSAFLLVVEKKGTDRVASVYQGNSWRASAPIPANAAVDLALELKNDRLTFSMKQGQGGWNVILADLDATALSTDQGGKFRGSMVGLYASSRGQASQAKAAFDFFAYTTPKNP